MKNGRPLRLDLQWEKIRRVDPIEAFFQGKRIHQWEFTKRT